jgi:hypothetical protein
MGKKKKDLAAAAEALGVPTDMARAGKEWGHLFGSIFEEISKASNGAVPSEQIFYMAQTIFTTLLAQYKNDTFDGESPMDDPYGYVPVKIRRKPKRKK